MRRPAPGAGSRRGGISAGTNVQRPENGGGGGSRRSSGRGRSESRAERRLKILAADIASWMRKRGKSLRPELTPAQRGEIKECFALMDTDGSGTVDVDEVHAAMKLLGMKARRRDVERMVNAWDADGSGEIELPEFIEMMTSEIQTQIANEYERREAGAAGGGAAPHSFQMIAQGLRRKNLLDKVMTGDKAARMELQGLLDSKKAFALADGGSRYARRRSVFAGGVVSHASVSRFIAAQSEVVEKTLGSDVGGGVSSRLLSAEEREELRAVSVSREDMRAARGEAAARLRLADTAARRAESSLFTLWPKPRR